MNTLIVHRETSQMPGDGWYQLAPLGEFPHAWAGVVQVVHAEACAAMAERSRRTRQLRTLPDSWWTLITSPWMTARGPKQRGGLSGSKVRGRRRPSYLPTLLESCRRHGAMNMALRAYLFNTCGAEADNEDADQ